ncbi:hypothetical protein Dsin_004811 [Dipteronia sinensis]|uniref:Ubiquitin-like protease family profile domain-containing protein n=1 Tax=Dipteronia sinensis TaxID=43782 RepID=A0AAE0EEB1_9ROSI|nr:hypothetical protein Dsin_004811 [Dipteronia sinensis]
MRTYKRLRTNQRDLMAENQDRAENENVAENVNPLEAENLPVTGNVPENEHVQVTENLPQNENVVETEKASENGDLDQYLVHPRNTWAYDITITVHCKLKLIDEIKTVLADCGELDDFKKRCFRHYLDMPHYMRGLFQAQYIHNLLLRQIRFPSANDDEMWFALGKTKDYGRQVTYWLLSLVEDIEAFNLFPWGHYVFKMTLHYIRIGFKVPKPMGPGRRYNLYGFIWGVQFWAMEAIQSMRKKLGNRFAPQGRPSFKKWEFIKRGSHMSDSWLKKELEGKLTGLPEISPTRMEEKEDYWLGIDDNLSEGPQFVPLKDLGTKDDRNEHRGIPVEDPHSPVQHPSSSDNQRTPSPTLLEQPTTWLGNDHVDAYINLLCKRKQDPVQGRSFPRKDSLSSIWRKFQPNFHRPLLKPFYPKDFEVPTNLIIYAIGEKPAWGTPWADVDDVLVPCNVGDSHWVLCVVRLNDWVITIFDSAAHLQPNYPKYREQ